MIYRDVKALIKMNGSNVRKFPRFLGDRAASTVEYSRKLPGIARRTTDVAVSRAGSYGNRQSDISDDTLIAVSLRYRRRESPRLRRQLHLYSDAISILREPPDEWRVNDTCPRTSWSVRLAPLFDSRHDEPRRRAKVNKAAVFLSTSNPIL